jgi:hypothetical protein
MSLFLTLVRIRLALPVFVMSDLFGVSCSRISSVFTTWIFCLYYIFRDCMFLPLILITLFFLTLITCPVFHIRVIIYSNVFFILLKISKFGNPDILSILYIQRLYHMAFSWAH